MNNFPTYSDVCIINEKICRDSGEPFAVINKNNIMSTLSVNDSYFETDEEIASALFRSLIVNHGFLNANKRTAFIIINTLLEPKTPPETIEKLAIEIANNGKIPIDDIVSTLYKNIT